MTRAEIWAEFAGAALEHLNDEGHLGERADTAAKLADYMLQEFDRRFPKYKAVQS